MEKTLQKKDYLDTKKELDSIYEKALELSKSIKLDSLKKDHSKLREETFKDDFWKDRDKVTKINLEISRLEKRISLWDNLLNELSEDRDLMEMALDEYDSEILNDISDKIILLRKRFDEIETLELFTESDDFKNAFITIRPGAGGTESQDWALMLYRMYIKWSENQKFDIDVIDYSPCEYAGIKSATIHIKGDYVYGFLKCENGVHRLVRISPFDTNKRRHTSFASVEAIPEVEDNVDIEIDETQLRIDTYRSSGAGGQHVNTSDSAVRITHIPTGIVVQCQNERSQHNNKSFAMKVLRARLYELKQKELKEKMMEKVGEKKDISWGSQIRSYIFQPYTLVKDHRTSEETGNVESVLNGEINRFIYAYLKSTKQK